MNNALETGKKVLRILNENGHLAYFVGGFVRDFLLGTTSSDIDITSSATPDEVTRIFPGTKATGVKYGTVTVFLDHHSFEVTTFRTDGDSQDARHPDEVGFTRTLSIDLERRDFTVNALAMDAAGDIIDLYGGRADLEAKILRAIGDPARRFREDALRILRAFRFVARLDFTIEPKTFEGIRANRALLDNVSGERVLTELKYIVRSPYAVKAYAAMAASGVLDRLEPIAAGVRFLAVHDPVKLSFEEFAALCFFLGDHAIPASWRLSNRERQSIQKILNLVEVTEADAFDILIVYVNGLDGCLAANAVNRTIDPARNQEDAIRAMDAALPIHKTCELAFKGDDILASTPLTDARTIGGIIDDLIYQVITGRVPNDYTQLREHALSLIRRMGERHDG
ncbi:MAG TPA: CCA tRNA nucleotidyltransferase [Acholeplasmatales bacterium]|nr:CCA tRNA nucleotidyltransferase [Acholeplasmatales bacterium]